MIDFFVAAWSDLWHELWMFRLLGLLLGVLLSLFVAFGCFVEALARSKGRIVHPKGDR